MNEVYVVKRGDTLYGISNQFGVSVSELAELNGVIENTLQIGQQLIIPSKSGTNPDNLFLYTVQKGDTLYGIAKKYGVSVDSIKKLNYMNSNQLTIGQVLRIPEMYYSQEEMNVPSYENYVVKRGDTLYSISQKYGVSVDTIMEDNGLQNMVLQIGQNLKIRNVNPVVLECFGDEYIPDVEETYISYTVKKGDNLYSIARQYDTSVSDLIRINNLSGSALSIGQILKIPSVENTYIVQKGDTLYNISKKFQTTVDEIKKKNNLSNNALNK